MGSRSEKEWFLKEIEITNLTNSVTWLCEFNCWLPKQQPSKEQIHVKPNETPRVEIPVKNLTGSLSLTTIFTHHR